MPEGWLSDGEAAVLRLLAWDKTVLELGAWKGRSTVALAGTARYVVSVDRHRGIPSQGGEDSLPAYLQAVRPLDNVAVVVADFERFLPLLRGSFDLAYVDGSHDAASVTRDARIARTLARTLAFHDWDLPSVRDSLERVLGKPHGVVGSLAVYAETSSPGRLTDAASG